MNTTNEPYIEENVLHNQILYSSERLLCEALYRKDIKGAEFIWSIVKTYRKVVNDEQYKQIQNKTI